MIYRNEVKLKDVLIFNPTESLSKNSIAKKIDMDKLTPFTRSVSGHIISKYNGGSKFRNGDVLFARITPCLENGKTALVNCLDDEEVAFGSTEFIVLRALNGLAESKYIFYLMCSDYIRDIAIKSMVGSSGRQRVQQGLLENTTISLPPLPEQRAIVSVLSALDDKIELNNRINKTLEELAQALFKRWFVDFEFPDENGNPYRSSGGAMVYSPEMGKEIPEGWRIGTLGDVVEFSNGYAFASSELLTANTGECFHVFKMGHICRGGGLNKSETKSYISKSACNNLLKYVLKKGDLLMCMTDMKSNVALLGHTALMDEDDKYILNQRVGLIRTRNEEIINYPYLYILTNNNDFIDNLRSRANSGVQVNLSTSEIKASKILLPCKRVHLLFDEIVKPFYDHLFLKQKENEYLNLVRNDLLKKLMSGEITVPVEEIS